MIDGFNLTQCSPGEEGWRQAYLVYLRFWAIMSANTKSPALAAGIELGERIAVALKEKVESEGRKLDSLTWDEYQMVVESFWKGSTGYSVTDQDYDSGWVALKVLAYFWKYGVHICRLEAEEASRRLDSIERNSGRKSKIANEWRERKKRWEALANPETRSTALAKIWETLLDAPPEKESAT